MFELYLPNTEFDLLGVLYIDVASQMLLIVTADLELYDLTCCFKLRQRVSVKLPEVLVKIRVLVLQRYVCQNVNRVVMLG